MAIVTVDVYLIEYQNPTSQVFGGNGCYGNCNNQFTFCLRQVHEKGECLARLTTSVYAQDRIVFPQSYHSQLRISNPLRFSDITTSVSDKEVAS